MKCYYYGDGDSLQKKVLACLLCLIFIIPGCSKSDSEKKNMAAADAKEKKTEIAEAEGRSGAAEGGKDHRAWALHQAGIMWNNEGGCSRRLRAGPGYEACASVSPSCCA